MRTKYEVALREYDLALVKLLSKDPFANVGHASNLLYDICLENDIELPIQREEEK